MKTINLTLSFILISLCCFAQQAITGRVISQTDNKAVSDASVFLSNATIGTKTTGDGSFKLQNVKPGRYELIVSVIGFDSYKQTIIINNTDVGLPAILLSPKTIALSQVTVKAGPDDAERQKYFDKFKAEFLGSTELAKQCKILNPELLDFNFDTKKNILTASSIDFLEIENKGLGYKIKYLLNDFTLDNSDFDVKKLSYNGYVLFEKLKGTPSQEKEWDKVRSDVYHGSQMHFLRSAVNNTLSGEGFRVLRLPLKPENAPDTIIYVDKKTYIALKKQKPAPVISGPDNQGLYQLINNKDRLYVSYNKYHHFSDSRYTRLRDPGNTLVDFTASEAFFDNNGTLTDPRSVVYDGAWALTGVAGLLPIDYEDAGAPNTGTAQIKNIISKLTAYADSEKTEKVYMHFDKPYYAAGDTIYFKAYVTGGGSGRQPSPLSGILQVDLINAANKITRAIKLPLNNGLGWGDFALDDTLKGGNYRVRAYTNWMRNEGEESFFSQIIPVGTAKVPESGASGVNSVRSRLADVQFLPEGGSLVAGNYSKIAFKAVAANGLGTAVKGTVTDDTGNEVCTFESAHLGMGVFNIVAQAGKSYYANVTFSDGATRVIELPKAVNTGYTLNINNTGADTLRLRITAANGMPVDKFSLIAQSGSVVCYAAESVPGSKFFSAAIPKSRFPSGVARFTVFNATGEPLNERLVFVNNNDQLKLDLKAKESYTTRQKVKIDVDAEDGGKRPVIGSFSVAVTDETNVPVEEQNENTILTNLLLTSDLRGTVESPGYYFAADNDKTRTDMDVLMLTQGYRHFEWKKILKDSLSVAKYQPEKTMTISGTVKRSGKPVAGSRVTLFTKSAGGLLRDTVSRSDGKFIFGELIFADSTRFVVQAKVIKGQDNVRLTLDTPGAPQVTIESKPDESGSNAAADMSAYLQNQKRFYLEQQAYGINKHALMLKEVTVKDKKNFVKNSLNLNGAGNADRVVTADEIKELVGVTLSFRLKNKLYGDVDFRRGIPYSMHSHMTNDPMLIVIDDHYAEYDEYDKLDPDRVQSVEVLASPNFGTVYGGKGESGVLVITTKRGKDYVYERYAPGVIIYKPPGFYKAREFYSPQYDNPHTNQKMADLRSTIYWNPNIITDKDGKASFSYFNADGKGTYRVVIEGIDADGNLGRQVFRYKVE